MIAGFLVNLLGYLLQLSIIPEPWEFYTLIPALVNLFFIVIVLFLTKNKTRALEEIYFD